MEINRARKNNQEIFVNAIFVPWDPVDSEALCDITNVRDVTLIVF